MSSKVSSGGVPPTILERPTLGYGAFLGELFDERTGKFLGIQLFKNSAMKKKISETVLQYSDLKLSISNTFEEKATVIDVNAELAVEILGGLVSVKGSASYLNDSKSNTHEQAFGMSLKLRNTEKRLRFAELNLTQDSLYVAKQDYIAEDLATHFVSSIIFGGSLIINLVAEASKLEEEETIEGALEAELQKLNGVVDLNGKADLEIKQKFAHLDGKFDLVLHGDIALKKVPVNVQDVLDTFPEACELIGDGVPISVTLQPIPAEIRNEATIVYRIDKKIVEDILRAFGNLEDVASRFAVLRDIAKTYRTFIPKYDIAVRTSSADFLAEHRKLLARLSAFVSGSRRGSQTEDGSHLAEDAETLYNSHTKLSGEYIAPAYHSNLVGLENARFDFEELIVRVESAGHHLAGLHDISLATSTGHLIPLFVMSPLETYDDVALIRFISLTRVNETRYLNQNPPAQCFILYAEDPSALEAHFPNGNQFASLKTPQFWVGRISDVGEISWVLQPDPLGDLGAMLYDMEIQRGTYGPNPPLAGYKYPLHPKVNAAGSFTVMIRGKRTAVGSDPNDHRSNSALAYLTDGKINIAVFRVESNMYMDFAGPTTIVGQPTTRPLNQFFWMTFVQDKTTNQLRLYVDGEKIAEKAGFKINWGKLTYGNTFPYNRIMQGFVHKVQVYSDALTQEQIAYIAQTPFLPKDTDNMRKRH